MLVPLTDWLTSPALKILSMYCRATGKRQSECAYYDNPHGSVPSPGLNCITRTRCGQ